MPPSTVSDRRLAETLVARGLVSEAAARGALAIQEEALRRGEERSLTSLLVERGDLDRASLVSAILDVRTALAEDSAEDPSAKVVPALGEILIAEGAVTADQLREALAIQDALQEHGLRLRLGDVLVDLGWVDRAVVEARANGQERWASGRPTDRPGSLDRIGALDPDDRRFALRAIERDLLSRLQLHDAAAIQGVYRRWKVEKRLHEILEELKYLSVEDSSRLLEEIGSDSPRRSKVPPTRSKGKRIGEVALELGLLQPAVLEAALDFQRALARRRVLRPIGGLLVEMGALSPADLEKLLALEAKTPPSPAPVEADGPAGRTSRRAWIGAGAVGLAVAGILAARSGGRPDPQAAPDAGRHEVATERPAVARELARKDYDLEMSRRGFVHHDGRWIAPEEKARRLEEAMAAARRAEGRVLHRGRWILPGEVEHELQREQAERLGLVEIGGEWYSPGEVQALRGEAPAAGRPSPTPAHPAVEAPDRLAIEVAFDLSPAGDVVHFRGRVRDAAERTIVRVLLLPRRETAGRSLVERTVLCEEGQFRGVLEAVSPPYFPGAYRLRVEADEAGGVVAAEAPFEIRSGEAAAAALEARDEIESAIALLRSLASRSRRAGALLAAQRSDELDHLAEAMVDAAEGPAADVRFRGAPFRETRHRLRALPRSPWLDPEGDLDLLDEELDRVEVGYWTEVAILGGLEGTRALAASVAREAARLADAPVAGEPIATRASWFVAAEVAARYRDLEAALEEEGADRIEFAAPWLGSLRALLARCARLAGSPFAGAIGRLAEVWVDPDPTAREDLARRIDELRSTQADPSALADVLATERDRVRDLLEELAAHTADAPDAWEAWSDEWTARVLRAAMAASPLVRSPDAAGPGRAIVECCSLLLEARGQYEAVRSGRQASPSPEEIEGRIRETLEECAE